MGHVHYIFSGTLDVMFTANVFMLMLLLINSVYSSGVGLGLYECGVGCGPRAVVC